MKLLNEILGTKYPIIQGGMANIATGEFAAACSNAGALGLIGAGGMNAETLRENIHRCKALTDKPFGVNIMLMHPQADEFAKIVVEEGVKVVTTGAGNPGKYIPMWKEAGIKVIPVVAAAVLAKHLAPLGVDAVIAEGTESGGHVGEMTTMALVPQVVDAVDVPVIAAGGIADGRQLAAAFALGACGVQVGTCLLVSEECPVHENYKAALLRAKDSDTIVTGRIGGTPVRVLKNRMSREYVRQEKAGADKMELEKYTLGSLRRAVFEGDTATGSLMAGQVAGMLHEVRPVAEILDELWESGRHHFFFCNSRRIVEIFLHQSIVKLSYLFKHFISPFICFINEICRYFFNCIVSSHCFIMPIDSFHFNQVYQTFEGFFSTNRNNDWTRISTQNSFHLAYNLKEVSTRTVHFVYVRNTWHIILISLTPYSF